MNKKYQFIESEKLKQKEPSFSISKAILYSFIAIIVWQVIQAIITAPVFTTPALNHIFLPLGSLIGAFIAITILLKLTNVKSSYIMKSISYPFSLKKLVLAIACWIFFLPPSESITDIVPTDGAFADWYKVFESGLTELLNHKVSGFLIICIVAPIFEEILFRGIILKGMLNYKINSTVAILISAFIFGIAHMNPWQFIGAGLLGTVFGFVYYRTKSLILPIILHFLNNTFSFILLLNKGEEQDIFFGNNSLLIISLTSILGCLSLFILYRITNTEKQNS